MALPMTIALSMAFKVFCLEEVPVHGTAHDDRLVNGFQGFLRRHTRKRLEVDGRKPVHALQERVGCRGELRRRSADCIPRRRSSNWASRGHLARLHRVFELEES